MNAHRVEKNDRVATILRYGAGLEKRRTGTVIALGAKGARVRFDDGATRWLSAGELRPLDPIVSTRRSLPNEDLSVEKVPMPTPAESSSPPPLSLNGLKAQGLDPMAMYLALGAALRQERAETMRAAEAAVRDADEQVAQAEALLVEARREAAAARQRLEIARAAQVEMDRGPL